MIKALIFDADGPLYYRSAEVLDRQLALLQAYGYPGHLDHRGLNHLNKYGHTGSLDQYNTAYEAEKFKAYAREESEFLMVRRILHALSLKLPNAKLSYFVTALNRILSQVTAQPGAKTALSNLKASGYQICILTDSFHPSTEKWRWFSRIGLAPYIDHIVSSYDIRTLKDTPEAYQACLDTLQTAANQTVFIGHQPYEMTGARRAGIRSVAIMPIAPPDIKSDYKVNSINDLPTLLKQLS